MKGIVLDTNNHVDRDRMYCSERLAEEFVELHLPFDYPRPAVSSFIRETYRFTIDRNLNESIKTLSQFEQISPQSLLMTIFKILMLRYSSETDICIGLCTSNNNQKVVRTQLEENMTFREALQVVKEVSKEALDHQSPPFYELIAELSDKHIDEKNALFNVLLDFQSEDDQLPFVDLSLRINEVDHQLKCMLVYDKDLFEKETMVRLEGHFNKLLEGIIENPEVFISQIPMLTAREEHQLLVEWNQETTDYPRDASVDQLFEEQVKLYPDNVAIIYGGEEVTYHELNERANNIASYLRELNLSNEQLVAVCLNRSPDMIASFLGVLKAGGAYVPIDLTYPEERIAYMLEDSGVSFVITNNNIVNGLPPLTADVICLDLEETSISNQSKVSLDYGESENLAYVIYTSGSTGNPKGVMVEHRGIVRLVGNTKYANTGIKETFINLTAVSFDVSVFEIYGALLNGGKLVILDSDKPSFEEIARGIRENQVTSLCVIPGMLNLLLEDHSHAMGSLRQILSAGEALPVWLAHKCMDKLANCELINAYGPSENSVYSTSYHVKEVQPHSTSIPIGYPISDDCVYILDKHLQPVPIGIIGELYLSGEGIARGYLNKPQLTNEVFISSAFNGNSSGSLYKTGDLAYFKSDGKVEFIGRIDNQVKIRGTRIELGEIETIIGLFPGIRQVVVGTTKDKNNENELVGYIVMNKAEVFDQRSLRSYVREKVPEHMIPTYFVEMQEIPVTPVGKTDRKNLPTPTVEVSGDQMILPRNQIEKRLVQLWEDILDIHPIGVKDNYFELGGNSLLAMQMFAKIDEILGSRLPVSIIFEEDTIEKLARKIEMSSQNVGKPDSLVPIQKVGMKPPLFCVHGGGGEVLVYKELANKLGKEQPLYGLRFINVDDHENISVESLAEDYIQEIKNEQPSGPYYLFGYCFGGAIAYEMAQQLIREGEEIASLTILNFANPKRKTVEVRNEVNYKRVIKSNLQLLFKMPLKQRLSFFSRKVTNAIKLVKSSPETAPPIDELTKIRIILGKAIKIYKPKPYPNEILLIRANEYKNFGKNLGWETTKDGYIREYSILAEHEMLLKEPHVGKVVTYLTEYLSEEEMIP